MKSVVEREALNKPMLCWGLVTIDPLGVIARVFDSIDFDYFPANLNRWFHAAIINQNHVYEEGCRRKGLQTFYVDVELLLEALYVLNRIEPTKGSEEKVSRPSVLYDKVYLLTQDQADNPHEVIRSFFKMVYIWLELKDWLQAGIDINESEKVQLKPIKVLLTYNDLKCLLEAAYQYYKITVKG